MRSSGPRAQESPECVISLTRSLWEKLGELAKPGKGIMGGGEGGEVPLWHTKFLEGLVASLARKATTVTAAKADGTMAETYLQLLRRLNEPRLIPPMLGRRCFSCTLTLNGGLRVVLPPHLRALSGVLLLLVFLVIACR